MTNPLNSLTTAVYKTFNVRNNFKLAVIAVRRRTDDIREQYRSLERVVELARGGCEQ